MNRCSTIEFSDSTSVLGGILSAANRLRAVIAGPGSIAYYHADALRRAGVEIAAIVGSRRSTEQAKAFDVPIASTDLVELIEQVPFEVLHICTPNALHVPMARAAILAGKHVVCEKPLALSSRDSAELVALAGQAGIIHAVCFNNRLYPLVQEMMERVRSGTIGRVFAIRASIVDDSLLEADDGGWRLDSTVGGEAVVVSTLGSHLLDLVSHVAGEPIVEVCADFMTCHPRRRHGDEGYDFSGEEVANILVRFASGARGVLAMSQVVSGRPYRVAIEIDAARNAMAWDSESPNTLWVGARGEATQLLLRDQRLLSDHAAGFTVNHGAYREGFADTFFQLVRHVYADIARHKQGTLRKGPTFYPTFLDGHRAVMLQEAIVASARSNSWVSVAKDPK